MANQPVSPLTSNEFEFLLSIVTDGEVSVSISDGPTRFIAAVDPCPWVQGSSAYLRVVEGDKVLLVARKGKDLIFKTFKIGKGYEPLDDPDFAATAPEAFQRMLRVFEEVRAEQDTGRARVLAQRGDRELLDALKGCARAIVPDHISIKPIDRQLELVVNDPDGYLRRFSKRLSARGINELIEGIHWLAMIDALAEQGLLEEIDWKEGREGVAEALSTITQHHAALADFRARIPRLVRAEATSTPELLEVIAEELEKERYQLVYLDIQSDSYPLTVLPRSQRAMLDEHAANLSREARTDF